MSSSASEYWSAYQTDLAFLLRAGIFEPPGTFASLFSQQLARDKISADPDLLAYAGTALEDAFFDNGKRRSAAQAAKRLRIATRALVKRYAADPPRQDAQYRFASSSK